MVRKGSGDEGEGVMKESGEEGKWGCDEGKW